MNEAKKDRLLIKKEALKAKKGLVDALQLLKDKGPSGRNVFSTNCWYLTEAVKIDEWDHFKNLLDSFEVEGIARFLVNPNSTLRWGDAPVTVEISPNFDSFADVIRSEYYSVEKEISNLEKPAVVPISVKKISETDSFKELKQKIEDIDDLRNKSSWGAEYQLWLDLTEKIVLEKFGKQGLNLFKKQQSVLLSNDAYIRELESRRMILEGLIKNKDHYTAKDEKERTSKKVGILNTGKNNTFIGNVFHGHDLGIQDEGEGTIAKLNKFFQTSHNTEKIKPKNIFEKLTNNQTFAIIVGGLFLLIIIYLIYKYLGVNLSQFN
ncbi:MAG: hypothetical protein WC059_03995 [Candidatus Paceibacterota bacterium]